MTGPVSRLFHEGHWYVPEPPLPGAASAEQRALLEFIRTYTAEHGFAPTIREMAAGMNQRSNGSIYAMILRLEKDGFVTRRGGHRRGITIVERGTDHAAA